jgi:hypothetical protein
MTPPNPKPQKKLLVKVRKAGPQPALGGMPVLPSERAWKLHQLALKYHAEEQAEVQKRKEQEEKR